MVGTVITYRTTSFLRQRRRRSTQITVELDDLIFVEHIINSFNLPIIFMQLMSILFPEQSKVVMGSKEFSFIYFIPYQLILAYRAIGGLGIAGVRVLCISFHNVVRGIGAKRLVDCTALGMLMLSVIPGFGGSIESFVSDPQFMICFTLGYKLSASKFDAYKQDTIFLKISAVTFSIFNIVEFICHLILFIQTRIQHKKHVQLCLQNKPKLAKLKKQKNTISSIGHFTSWLAEMLIFGSLHYIIRASGKTAESGEFYLRLLIPSINFVVFPAVQALTSHELRGHVFSLDFLREICFNIHCKFKSESNNVEVGDVQDIELQSLGNNNASFSGSNNILVRGLFEEHSASCILPHELNSMNAKVPHLMRSEFVVSL